MIIREKNKRFLITGGAGFIGSHLCRHLLELGHRVICMDNLTTGSIENLSSLLHHPHFRFIEWDITAPFTCNEPLDGIYNLACPASPVHYQSDPVATTRTSVLGILHMLELARHHGCKLLQASTSEVYGNPLVHPQKESYWGNVNPNGIRSCYDEGKRCAESLCMDYHRQYGVEVKLIRIFNTYGPHMATNDGRVVSNFILQALHDEEITIYGDGSQTRSFQYVSDLVEGMLRMMETNKAFTGPVNLGNPHEITVRQLAEEIIRLTHSHSRICYRPLPSDDPCRRCPDITLANTVLDGWMPQVQLEEGLLKTIDYFHTKITYHETEVTENHRLSIA